jgi:hypothetical protein
MRVLGSEVVNFEPASRGYTHQRRGLATLADGRRFFMKQAVDDTTTAWLRTERAVYEHVSGPFIPFMVEWLDDPVATLVLEDLSTAEWPPPWTPDSVRLVLAALEMVASHDPPVGLPRAVDGSLISPGWAEVAESPSEFLALGLCSGSWLDAALPQLLTAEAEAPLDGVALLHGDVRSDNLCFRARHVTFVDWNIAMVGNPLLDVAFWLPSLACEGGPLPDHCEVAVPPELAAFVAGFFAARAGRPFLPQASRVREVQREQLREALPWAVRALQLPLPE